jgi:hypothetical protein
MYAQQYIILYSWYAAQRAECHELRKITYAIHTCMIIGFPGVYNNYTAVEEVNDICYAWPCSELSEKY